MKKIKMLVNSIVNGSIGTQIVAGVVAVTVLGGAAFGGYKVYKNLETSRQESFNRNVESLKAKITELKDKASKLPSSDEVNSLQAELADLEVQNIEANYDKCYDRYVDAEDKYEELLKNYKAEMKALLEELEDLDVSKFDETQLMEFEVAVQNYETVTNMDDFRGYKSMYEEAKKVYDKLASTENPEASVESVNEESTTEEAKSENESVANNTTSSTTTNSNSTNSGSTSNSASTSKPSNSGSNSNSGSTNNGSTNTGSTGSTNTGSTGSTNTGSSNGGSTNTTPSTPAPSTPQYETFNGFSYNLSSEGMQSGYVGGDNNYASKFSTLSSKSTVSSFVGEANKAVQALTQGAYDEKVKAKFMNKVYNGKYLITGVSITRYTVPVIDNGELVVDPYSYLVRQGVENLPGGLFATVVGNYGDLNGQEGYDSFVRIVIQFKEI